MKRIIAVVSIFTLLIASCSKTSSNSGLAAAWVGNYDAAGINDTVDRIAVTQTGSNTVNLALEVSSNGGTTFVNPITLSGATVQTDSTASFDGWYLVNSTPRAWHVVGTASAAAISSLSTPPILIP